MKTNHIILFFFVLIPFFYTLLLHAAQKVRFEEPIIIAVPAICGNKTYKGYSEKILALMVETHYIYKTGTLSLAARPDLGQQRCINHLQSKIQEHTKKPFIFVATSQGSATVTNYLAQTPTIYNNLKGLIFEGFPASFNQSIVHTIESRLPFTAHLPLKDYLLPYIAQYWPYLKGVWFPFCYYNPAETQPFEQLKNVPLKIPIVFVHCQQDRITPHDGAQIAYYYLKAAGHENVYLISINVDECSFTKFDDGHINVLQKDTQEHLFLQKIMDSILYGNQHNLIEHQPDCLLFQDKAEQLKRSEFWVKKIRIFLTVLKYCSFLYIVWKKILKKGTPQKSSFSYFLVN